MPRRTIHEIYPTHYFHCSKINAVIQLQSCIKHNKTERHSKCECQQTIKVEDLIDPDQYHAHVQSQLTDVTKIVRPVNHRYRDR